MLNKSESIQSLEIRFGCVSKKYERERRIPSFQRENRFILEGLGTTNSLQFHSKRIKFDKQGRNETMG